MKLFKGKLNTAGKTIKQLAEYTDTQLQEKMLLAYEKINGLEVVVTNSLDGEGYTLIAWRDEDSKKFLEFIYQSEQDPLFGTYVDKKDEFISDWESGDYTALGAFCFSIDEVNIVEEITYEEIKNKL